MFNPTTCVRLRYGYLQDMLSGFSRWYDYMHSGTPEGVPVLSGSTLRTDLPVRIGIYTLKPAIPSAGGIATPTSPRRS